MNDDPHVQLMLRLREGDETAFTILFNDYKLPLLNFIYRYCGDQRVAEELCQEVFLRVYKSSSRYQPEARFSTWLYRIATNVCLNEIRAGRNRHECVDSAVRNSDDERPFDAQDNRHGIHADECVLKKEQEHMVRGALDALPDKQRMALVMNAYEDLSYREIGSRMEMSEGAVKSLIFRAKTALKEHLRRRSSRDGTSWEIK